MKQALGCCCKFTKNFKTGWANTLVSNIWISLFYFPCLLILFNIFLTSVINARWSLVFLAKQSSQNQWKNKIFYRVYCHQRKTYGQSQIGKIPYHKVYLRSFTSRSISRNKVLVLETFSFFNSSIFLKWTIVTDWT